MELILLYCYCKEMLLFQVKNSNNTKSANGLFASRLLAVCFVFIVWLVVFNPSEGLAKGVKCFLIDHS